MCRLFTTLLPLTFFSGEFAWDKLRWNYVVELSLTKPRVLLKQPGLSVLVWKKKLINKWDKTTGRVFIKQPLSFTAFTRSSLDFWLVTTFQKFQRFIFRLIVLLKINCTTLRVWLSNVKQIIKFWGLWTTLCWSKRGWSDEFFWGIKITRGSY